MCLWKVPFPKECSPTHIHKPCPSHTVTTNFSTNICCHLWQNQSWVSQWNNFRALHLQLSGRPLQHQVILIDYKLSSGDGFSMSLKQDSPLLLTPHHVNPECSTLFYRRQYTTYCVIFDLLPSLPSHDLTVYMFVLLSVWTRSHESFLDLNLTVGQLKEESGSADG